MTENRYTLPRLIAEPHEAYHARRSSHMSSHALADFRKSPLLFKKKRAGLIPQFSRAFEIVGQAAHCLILEGEQAFRNRYLVSGGPINKTTGKPFGSDTKTYKEWAAAQSQEVLSDDDYALCVQLEAAVRSHAKARELLAEGTPEATFRADYCGTPCQIRLDWISARYGVGIVDLKTCADLDKFEATARSVILEYDAAGEVDGYSSPAESYGYLHQLAFYREILALQMNGELLPCWFIAVEKKEPFRCGVWQCSDASLDAARRDNEAALSYLLECRDAGHWPTGYESIRTL